MFFNQISILLVFAAVFGLLAKWLRQPIIIGYLFAGFLLSALGLIKDPDILANLGKIGVALLLFLVGLEIKIKDIPSLGKIVSLSAILQVFLSFSLTLLISQVLGFNITASFFLAFSFSISSTIIAIKLLSEKNDIESLYGKISVGILLIQDLITVFVILFLGGLAGRGLTLGLFSLLILKGALLWILIWITSRKILPFVFSKFIYPSQELLFIVSIAWALGLATFVAGPLGFSFEIGAFLAGLALSELPEHMGIASKTRSLRDFFLTIFFLYLGTNLAKGISIPLIFPAIIFSLFVLILKPLIILIILGAQGYKRRTSFLSAVTLSQVSEFAPILAALGLSLGYLTSEILGLVVLVVVVTMTTSTYIILWSEKIFPIIKRHLSLFERSNPKEGVYVDREKLRDHVILVGAGRTGRIFVRYFKRHDIPFFVVDFNPNVFNQLTADKTPAVLGDIADSDVYSAVNLDESRAIISTANDFHDNLTFLQYAKKLKNRPFVILSAQTKEEAITLYEKGATYVILPHFLAGEYLRHIFSKHGMGKERISKMGKGHFNRLIYST